MKALLIQPETRSIEEIDISGMDDIKSVIGYDTIESDPVGDDGDYLFFDEECFLRGTEGRFQIDTLIPVSGKGVVVGFDGEAAFKDVAMSEQELSGRLKYFQT
ncbi:MAG: hypothetical protein P8Z78_11980 [Gammaproteobacteria bacterium]|jgi:hypothetical protein